MAWVLDPAIVSEGGRYWTLQGVKTHLGEKALADYSNLGNEDRDLDMTQVVADGTKADDYVDMRATLGSKSRNWVVPILSTVALFKQVQEVADLYTAWLLVSHKIEADERAGMDESKNVTNLALGLLGRCELLASRLFGPVPDADSGEFQCVPVVRPTDHYPCRSYSFRR